MSILSQNDYKLNTFDYVVGIDAGERTGIAVKRLSDNEYIFVKTFARWKAALYIMQLAREHNIFVVYEDATQRSWFGSAEAAIYPKIKRAISTKYATVSEKEFNIWKGKLIGSGYAKADSQFWGELLKGNKIDFKPQAPKASKTKLNANLVAKISGYTGSTSNHARDAIMLVHGYNNRGINIYLKQAAAIAAADKATKKAKAKKKAKA